MKPCSLLWMCHFLDFLLRWSFFANLSRNWWKMRKSRLCEKYYSKWLQNQIEIKKRNFCNFYNFCWKNYEKASVKGLAGISIPRLNFDSANLREIKNPKERDHKIQNFRLKIPVFWAFENLVSGHWSIFLITDFFEP